MKNRKGFTLIEWVMVLLLCSILAMSFVSLLIPQINLFFFLPQQIRMYNFGQDLLNTIIEGDHALKGARYAGRPMVSYMSQDGVYRATGTELYYLMLPSRDSSRWNQFIPEIARITYDPSLHQFTRKSNIYSDGWAPHPIPYYASSGSGLLVDPISGNAVFNYYDADHNFLPLASLDITQIRFVEVAVRVHTGSGKVNESEGSMIFKSGVDIKKYTT